MKLFIIIIVCLIIITYYFYRIDGFANMEPDITQKYQKFISFYNPFLVSWEKAIITSIGLDTPVQPLTSPSQVSTSTFQQPTKTEMNQYIQKLIKKMEKPFPLLTEPLPDMIDSDKMEEIMKNIPMKPSIYKNALDWMNNGLETAQQQLQAMKKPEGFDVMDKYHMVESFEDCSQISKCLDARDAAQRQKEKDRQNEFGKALDECNNDAELQAALQKNQELVKKAKVIQDQAQSGELLSQMNLAGNEDPNTHYVLPKGANYLEDMERDDPEKYNSYKENNKQAFYMAQYTNDINRNLR